MAAKKQTAKEVVQGSLARIERMTDAIFEEVAPPKGALFFTPLGVLSWRFLSRLAEPDYLAVWTDIQFRSSKKLFNNTQGGLLKQIVFKAVKDEDETGMPEQLWYDSFSELFWVAVYHMTSNPVSFWELYVYSRVEGSIHDRLYFGARKCEGPAMYDFLSDQTKALYITHGTQPRVWLHWNGSPICIYLVMFIFLSVLCLFFCLSLFCRRHLKK